MFQSCNGLVKVAKIELANNNIVLHLIRKDLKIFSVLYDACFILILSDYEFFLLLSNRGFKAFYGLFVLLLKG